mmetsp:Transcript_2467/g.4484  ORF Transcript_2467/g.4484 Transcript_2467/m.4484 type:complete len:623 (+) Transcript_2467:83-1951(+)
MEEVILFLGQHGVNATLHIVYENERTMEAGSLFTKPTFDAMLKSDDPPHWMKSKFECSHDNHSFIDSQNPLSEDVQPFTLINEDESPHLASLDSYEVPEDFSVVYPFTYTISELGGRHGNETDREGWQYSTSFKGTSWHPVRSPTSYVRRRKWERLMVLKHQHHLCMCVVPEYYKQLTGFRCLHPLIIKASIGKRFRYRIQLVAQHQRKRNGIFSGKHLDADDPPEWAVGPSPELCDDPLQCDGSTIQPYEQFAFFDRTKGFDLLHDFIYALYPGKDEFGWEYNRNFFEESDLVWMPLAGASNKANIANDSELIVSNEKEARPKSECHVRRRMWFRTLVSDCDLEECRHRLSLYLAERPNTVSSDMTVYCLFSFGRQWRPVSLTLRGVMLQILNPLKNNKVMNTYDLRDHVMSVLGPQDCPGRSQGFGIRLHEHRHTHSFAAIFSAENVEGHMFWTEKIKYQMCQVDMGRRLDVAPPLSDDVLLKSDMWLKNRNSRAINKWGLKTLELHRSGYLKVYNGVHLKYQYDVINCRYVVKFARTSGNSQFCGDGTRFEFAVVFRSRESVAIRAMTQDALNQWLRALTSFHGQENHDVAVEGLMTGISMTQVFPEDEISLVGIYNDK